MSQIHSLSISNFRGIREFTIENLPKLVCLIGRGDSGKSTILDAINIVLSSNWNVAFFDNDFYNCDTSKPIIIEATLIDIPEELINESKFGLYLRGYNTLTGQIMDDPALADDIALTIRVQVERDLEPAWTVITNTEKGFRSINAADRSRLNAFLVSDYVDRHFSWSKGSPLYSLLKHELKIEEDDILLEVLREAKAKIDSGTFSKFEQVVTKVKASAQNFGIDISGTATTIDFKDIVMKDGKMSLHDKSIPFRLKGKGSKRLVSVTIQSLIAGSGGIVLIDEIEQGLEPDRVQHLVNTLKQNNEGQVFITTHSRDVLVELKSTDLFLMLKGNNRIIRFSPDLQGTLRKNPECFFARKVIVCEGATEIGICRALNRYRVGHGQSNISYLGVRFADGSGSQFFEYAKGFHRSKIPVCVLCDKDEKGVKASAAQKGKTDELAKLGIPVYEWEAGDCIETGVFKEVPFPAVIEMCELASKLLAEQFNITVELSMDKIKAAIGTKVGRTIEKELAAEEDSVELRIAMGTIASNQSWFKSQDKGFAWGQIIFKYINELSEGRLKTNIEGLNKWIDQ